MEIPSETNCAAPVGIRLWLIPFHSYADKTSFKHLELFTPNYGPLGNTMDPTNLRPASMEHPDTSYQQRFTQAPVQTCDTLHMHRTSLSSSPLTIAQRRNIARGSRSSSAPTSTPTNTLTSILTSTPISTPASAINYGQSFSARTITPTSLDVDSTISVSPVDSENTRRARYAANQRHSKAQEARKNGQQNESTSEADTRVAEQRQRHREKNKVAAAKCRLRQRKQVQRIQGKGSRLGGKNAELKTMIQELRGELYELRCMALDHQQCNCSVARYNHDQAKKIVFEYRSSCLEQGFEGSTHLAEQRSFQIQ
jgi:hypothetical protein